MESSSNAPIYTHPDHLKYYDTQYIGMAGAEIDLLTDVLDEVLYPESDSETVIGTNAARVEKEYLLTQFRHTFLRGEFVGWSWPLESVTVSVDHSIYMGRSAVRQCYKISVENSVLQSKVENEAIISLQNKVTTLYYIEETAGDERKYLASMIRPNILGIENPTDEPMTMYDCERLMDTVGELSALAIYDDREAKALDRL